MTTYLDRKEDAKPIRPIRKGEVKPMASSGVDRKEDVKPVKRNDEDRKEGISGDCRRKTICPNCGKTGMSPVMPDHLQPWVTETKTLFDLRKVDNMDMLFLLLGKFLRFYAVGLRLGLSEKRIPTVILPRGMTPKQAYIIALHYRLARILDPSNPSLDIGSWPFRNN